MHLLYGPTILLLGIYFVINYSAVIKMNVLLIYTKI